MYLSSSAIQVRRPKKLNGLGPRHLLIIKSATCMVREGNDNQGQGGDVPSAKKKEEEEEALFLQGDSVGKI